MTLIGFAKTCVVLLSVEAKSATELDLRRLDELSCLEKVCVNRAVKTMRKRRNNPRKNPRNAAGEQLQAPVTGAIISLYRRQPSSVFS